jgi:hypothetical protein
MLKRLMLSSFICMAATAVYAQEPLPVTDPLPVKCVTPAGIFQGPCGGSQEQTQSQTATATAAATAAANANAAGGAGGLGGTGGIGLGLGGNGGNGTGGTANAVGGTGVGGTANANGGIGVGGAADQRQQQRVDNAGNNVGQSTVVVQGDKAQARNPVSSAVAPTVSTGSAQCLVPMSAGAQGIGFGVSFGTATRDEICELIYLAREVRAMGYPEQALKMLRQGDSRVDKSFN